MAQININEISQNYTYNIGASSFAVVALPITSCWGPGYFDPDTFGMTSAEMLENTHWIRYAANQQGLEAFVAAYRGPASNYRLVKDYSYQMAMTLLTSGYDVLVCRVSPGAVASGELTDSSTNNGLIFTAKYPGTFGNNIIATLTKMTYYTAQAVAKNYWNLVVYVQDSAGTRTAVENLNFVFNVEDSTENIPYFDEIESKFVNLTAKGVLTDSIVFATTETILKGGTDRAEDIVASESTTALTDGGTELPTVDGEVVTDVAEGNIYIYQTEAKISETELTDGGIEAPTVDGTEIPTSDLAVGDKFIYMDTTYTDGKYRVLEWTASGVWAKLEDYDTLEEAQTAALRVNYYTWTIPSGQTTGAWVKSADYSDLTTAQTASSIPLTRKATIELASNRYYTVTSSISGLAYISALASMNDLNAIRNQYYLEWIYNAVTGTGSATSRLAIEGVYDLLKDRLNYNPNRVISPGWDDENINVINTSANNLKVDTVAPIHKKLMDIAYLSRCAAAYIDIPQSVAREDVYNTSYETPGYAQRLARFGNQTTVQKSETTIYSTHYALFAPWVQYQFVGLNKQVDASPSFVALMIERAQILNQAIQYEWVQPTNRSHSLNIGKPAYSVPQKLLDIWQSTEGVGVNVITTIPGLGTNVWGNSTCYEVPPATYQALANLSTRKLVNALRDTTYKAGIGITFQYNNGAAYDKFYAACTPVLDQMKNVDAIEDYRIVMSSALDVDGQVQAQSVVGKIYLAVNGIINNITVDLIALPAGTDLDAYVG